MIACHLRCKQRPAPPRPVPPRPARASRAALGAARPPRPVRCLAALLFAVALGLGGSLVPLGPFAPAAALASQLETDVICGTEVAESGLAGEDAPDITAANAIVVGSDGTVYFERDADEQVQIASVTKVMTAIVALEYADLDAVITVDSAAATVGQSSAQLQEGDTMDLETALRALLIASGNDAAVAIATSVGALIDPESDDPYQVFIDAMNEKAAELGMEDSVFTNPHGLDYDEWDEGLCSTARDVATMFAYGMQNEEFRALIASEDTTITVTGASGTERTITLTAHNQILGESNNIGGKTGSTNKAGLCFVGGFTDEDGNEIYTVVLGCEEEEDRWADTLELAGWYYDHLAEVPLVNTAESLAGAPVLASVALLSWTDKAVDATVADAAATATLFSLAGELTQTAELYELEGAVSEGDVVGRIVFEQAGEVVAELDLLAAESVAAPTFFEGIMVRLDRFVRSLKGEATVAEYVVYNEVPTVSDYLVDAGAE